MFKLFVRASLQWIPLVLMRIVLIVCGFVVVAIGIPFRVEGVSGSDGRRIVNLPKWLWLFGNDYDGLLGDKRGWWEENTPFGVKVDSFLAMWWWAAVRNPVNNMRFMDRYSAPVSGDEVTIDWRGDEIVEDKIGMGGIRLCWSQVGKKKWYGFYMVKEYGNGRAFVCRFGFKVKPSHAGLIGEERKGMTFKVNPWKDIS